MHQILAELCPFESFCKLFAAYCLEVIVCKFCFVIGIFLFNFFLHLLLDLQENAVILNLYKYVY